MEKNILDETIISSGAIVIFVMFLLYMIIGALYEQKQYLIGHETGIIIIIGLIVSFFSFYLGETDFLKMVTFDEEFFFYVCLPPIIFSQGFNMKRKQFFVNFKNILIFGLLGTIVQFIIFSGLTYCVVWLNILSKYNPETNTFEYFTMELSEILLMCSLLCCTDLVAAIAVVKYEEQPKLFSLIFGEGITNDAVCIILFNTVEKYAKPTVDLDATTPISIFWNFFQLSFFSILIGIIFGLLSSLVFKNFRFLTSSPIIECNLMFCFAYLAYSSSELFKFSGIISLLTSGILMAHYTWYNLSPQSKQVTSVTFQILGYGLEAFVFAYLGLTFFSYTQLDWSPSLFISQFLIIVIGRFAAIVGLIKFLQFLGYKSGVRLKDLVFIAYAGLIRGAVAFGLVLRIDKTVVN